MYSYLASVGWNWDCVLLPGIGGLELGHGNEFLLSCVLVLVLRSVQKEARFYVSLGL